MSVHDTLGAKVYEERLLNPFRIREEGGVGFRLQKLRLAGLEFWEYIIWLVQTIGFFPSFGVNEKYWRQSQPLTPSPTHPKPHKPLALNSKPYKPLTFSCSVDPSYPAMGGHRGSKGH